MAIGGEAVDLGGNSFLGRLILLTDVVSESLFRVRTTVGVESQGQG